MEGHSRSTYMQQQAAHDQGWQLLEHVKRLKNGTHGVIKLPFQALLPTCAETYVSGLGQDLCDSARLFARRITLKGTSTYACKNSMSVLFTPNVQHITSV